MSIVLGAIFVIVSVFLLLKGADWFMDGVEDLAPLMGISAVALGILLASLEPEEMFAAGIAAFRGSPMLAVGDVIGTNVVITTLALGLSALIFPIAISHTIRRQALLATIVSIIPILFLISGYVSRWAGLLMIVLFGGYTFLLFRKKPATAEASIGYEQAGDADTNHEAHQRASIWPFVGLIGGGLLAMTIGGVALVDGALRLATSLGISEGVIGATIVSLGTGAEMLALAVSAARRKRTDVLVGGVIGSSAYNLLVSLGVAALVRPLNVDLQVIRIALPMMILAHFLLLAFAWHGQIMRWMGGLLVIFYGAYLILVIIPGR